MKKFIKSTKIIRNTKGFTLVELIIVMVIIAILAAALVPTMMGYIDDSKNSANTTAARAYYVAAQSVVTKGVADGIKVSEGTDKNTLVADTTGEKVDILTEKWQHLTSELPGNVTFETTDNGIVKELIYTATNGKIVKITHEIGVGNNITYGS
ncbi:MAG: type II secretion system protein [Anaerotignaceae bacterium]